MKKLLSMVAALALALFTVPGAQAAAAKRVSITGEIVDTWLLGQHPTVITQGVRAKRDDIAQPSSLPLRTLPSYAQSAPAVFKIDRGGLTTLHSPGQMILYPITRVSGERSCSGFSAWTS